MQALQFELFLGCHRALAFGSVLNVISNVRIN